MSLKAFHLVFIALADLMCCLVGAWGVWRYAKTGSVELLALAILSFLLSGGLVVYGLRVWKKLQTLDDKR